MNILPTRLKLSPKLQSLVQKNSVERIPTGEATKEEIKNRLGSLEYRVTQKKQTEIPFSGKYVRTSSHGTYNCVVCGAQLFTSDTKFNSSSGWPSFHSAESNAVATNIDSTEGQLRVEALCRHCCAHLGHVFDDGPKPSGLRYCINSAALSLQTECDD